MATSSQLLCPTTKFQAFFGSLQPDQLIGFQSCLTEKLKRNLDSVNFDESKRIFESLHQKDIFRHKKNWKHNQVTLFLYIVDKACLKYQTDVLSLSDGIWEEIAELIPGRNGESCKTKMISLMPTNLNDTPWTQVEQDILAQVIEKEGTTKWKVVSLRLYEKSPTKIYRSSKQCRQRYMCFLKPDLKKYKSIQPRGFWSDEEDYELIMLFLKYGRKWSKMTQFIQGRNQNAIKNRFFLLFEQSSRSQKLYYSQFMRKVMRRKEKLERLLGVKKTEEIQQTQSGKLDDSLEFSKIESSSNTEREQKCEELAQIQKFFTF